MLASALIMSSPFPSEETRLTHEKRPVHLEFLAERGGRLSAIWGARSSSMDSAFSTSLCIVVVTAIELVSGTGMGRDIDCFDVLECFS